MKKSRETAGVHQSILFTKVFMFLPFVATRLLKYDDRLINGLFHSRRLDVHANEKIIILKLALPE